MTRDQIRRTQQVLAEQGYYQGPVDGIWGPQSAAAYDAYWAMRHVEISVPVQTPEPSPPWWASRTIWGALLVLLSLPAKLLFGLEYDPAEATDTVMPVVALIPEAMVAIGGVLAWWGRLHAKAPVDPGLVWPGVRVPQRVPGESVSADPAQSGPAARGYWSRPRGPFEGD
jgi:hypothetical protein